MNQESQINADLAGTSQNRKFSENIVSGTQKLIQETNWNNPLEIVSRRTELLLSLKEIAYQGSFLGFPGAVRLCRTVSAVVQSLGDGGKQLTSTQSSAIAVAMKSLSGLLDKPNSIGNARSQTIVQNLLSSFSIGASEIAAPLVTDEDKVGCPPTRPVADDAADPEHRDMDVYRSSRLDSLDQCEEEETWIVSQLAALAEDLASGTHSGHPANRLMHVLRGHKFFNQVDRVCLVGRVNQANQLVVVDACISERCAENALKKGYSCFVNPEGSLFSMLPGTMRIFADSERVLSSFCQQQKPAQRSIALISEQGHRSGLCLAIGRGKEIQGFLFLNSRQEDLFQNITLKFAPLISLFGLVATIALDTNGFHLTPTESNPINDWLPKSSTRFDTSEFLEQIKRSVVALQGPKYKCNLCVVRREGAADFLYLPSTLVNICAELITRTHATETNDSLLQLKVSTERDEAHVEFEHGFDSNDTTTWNWLESTVRSIESRFRNRPVKVGLSPNRIVITVPLEPLLPHHKHLLYSTVY